MGFIRTFIDNNLALAISLRDFARILVKSGAIRPRKRRIVEMTFNDITGVGKLTIAVGARNIVLAAAIHSAVAVVIGFALEQPLITRFTDPPSNRIGCASRKVRVGLTTV